MRPRWIWLAAIAVYGLFAFWYDAWKPPLDADEIDAYLARLATRGADEFDPERLATLRAFLESDDGGEFFMVNLMRLEPEPVAFAGDAPRPARDVLGEYTGRFLPGVFARGGHPAFFGRAAGRYLEVWDVEPDPGWTAAGIVRYRSRRDLMELIVDPRFDGMHAYKLAAIDATLAFPTAPAFTVVGPRGVVPLALALAAALAHLALLSRRAREGT
jgi:hypothetical protein